MYPQVKYENRERVIRDAATNAVLEEYTGFVKNPFGDTLFAYTYDGKQYFIEAELLPVEARADVDIALAVAIEELTGRNRKLAAFADEALPAPILASYVSRKTLNSVRLRPVFFGGVYSDLDITEMKLWADRHGISVILAKAQGQVNVIFHDSQYLAKFCQKMRS